MKLRDSLAESAISNHKMRIAPLAKRSWPRMLVECGVYFVLAACFIGRWLVAGLIVPCRVVGPSMATTLLGSHRDVVCADCGFRFACGVEQPLRRAVCPNCGYAGNELESLLEIRGDRLLFDQTAFALRAPRRWEVVALRCPRNAGQIVVKRVVGLPGEDLEVRDGDVYVNGEIARKDLAQQRELAILVHDAGYCPTLKPIGPPCWRSEGPEHRWRSDGGQFTHTAAAAEEPVAWLVYHHASRVGRVQRAPPQGNGSDGGARCARPTLLPDDDPSVIESPVTDLAAYDASPRREEDVHTVADLMLSFRLEYGRGRGTFCIRAADGREDFEARMRFDNGLSGYQVYRGGEPLAGPACRAGLVIATFARGEPVEAEQQGDRETRRQGDERVTAGERLVTVSLVDRQFLLALDNRTLVQWPYSNQNDRGRGTSRPFALGAQGIDVRIAQLRVYRDVYYATPPGLPATTGPVRLGADEYFLLGDNAPVSDDSRSWPTRGVVDGTLLWAKPFVAIRPTLVEGGKGGHFQVPNFHGIRYIP